MKALGKFFGGISRAMTTCAVLGVLATTSQAVYSQSVSRIHYAGRDIFVSGINVAWVNFAGDLGPSAPNLAQFQTEFQTVHANGGNVLRLWLHTNGSQTPLFDANGYVTGPGPVAIQNLKQILALAQQNDVGLILCLWSHDMLNQSELDTAKLHRNAKLLTDTAYTNAYIRNSLTPMVDSLKGHPAIVAWEIFNEPEGITNEFGWSGRDHVPIASIQACVNLMAGAIHRTDPSALVTSGAVTFQTLTDVNVAAKIRASELETLNSMPQVQIDEITDEFNARHRTNFTATQLLHYLNKIAAVPNSNYYRDDRLIAAGGDNRGTLDFYCVHYYANNGPALSPFLYPASQWALAKPIEVAEFYMQATDGLADQSLYPWLYLNGYAGAMVWSWTDFGIPPTNSRVDTWLALNYMFDNYRNDVIINPKTGSIYVFKASPSTIEKTDSTVLKWDVEPGSVVKLNGSNMGVKDSTKVAPLVTRTYTLVATGQVTDSNTVVVTVLPTGRIVSFLSIPVQIGAGESATLLWHVVKGSAVMLNGNTVPVVDTIVVYPTESSNTYTLLAQGDERDSMTITIPIYPPDQVDRALGAAVTVSSNDSITYTFSKPQNIVDGNNISRWQAAATPVAQSVQLDLGIVDSINKIIIRWGNKAYAKQYKVQTSVDLSNWSELVSVLSGTGGTNYVETLDNLNGVGRYVTFLLQAQGNGAYSIAEISIYGFPTTGIENVEGIPSIYSLSQNYPNPFNLTTTINFSLAKTSNVRLTVYNVLGQQIAVLAEGRISAGAYAVEFDASKLASGVYFYRLEAGYFLSNKKMMLLK
jgi:hypothetical protein